MTGPATPSPVQTTPRLTHLHGNDAIPGISQAVVVEHGRLAYLSGQVPLTENGDIPKDFETQLAQTFTNLGTALNDLGATTADLVRITIYVVDLTSEKLPAIRAARDRFLGDAATPRASALLGAAALFHPDAHVEIDAIVSLPS